MVASAFTIVSFGGTGYKVIEDGYTQLVSVFVIFCADGVLAESGGYCSITNSATNFGIHALRGVGFRREPYVFDIGTVTNVSATPTGRTILTIDGLGREPLEHYVVKVVDQNGDPYTNTSDSVEYFIDAVGAVGAGPPFQAELTIDDGNGQGMNLTNAGGSAGQVPQIGDEVRLHRPSIVNSSSHTWEFAGSGTNYLNYLKTVVLKMKQKNRYQKTMVVYMSLVLTNLVTSRLVHLLELKTELVLLPSRVRLPSLKLNS